MDTSSASSSSSPPRDDIDPSYYTLQMNSTPTATRLLCCCLSNPTVASQLTTLTQALQSAHGFLNRSVEHNLNNILLPNDSYSTPFVGNSSHHSHHLPPHPNQQFSPLPSPHTQEFEHYIHQSPHYSTTRTLESKLAPDATSSTSAPSFSHTPHQHIPSQWYQPVPSPKGSAGVNAVLHLVSPGYNPYFPNSPAIQQQATAQALYNTDGKPIAGGQLSPIHSNISVLNEAVATSDSSSIVSFRALPSQTFSATTSPSVSPPKLRFTPLPGSRTGLSPRGRLHARSWARATYPPPSHPFAHAHLHTISAVPRPLGLFWRTAYCSII